MPRARFPASVYDLGDEPDPRFSLANERTFLAWVRTSLALLALAVAIAAVDIPVREEARTIATLFLTLDAAVAAAWAWISWRSTETSLRLSRPLPGAGRGSLWMLAGLMCAVAALVAGVVA